MSSKRTAFFVAAALLVPGTALAAHGKVGLWSSTTTMSMPGMPPQSHSATFCMTAAEVSSDVPRGGADSACTFQNVTVTGHTISADMTCKGGLGATGHLTSIYDSDTHFTSTITMTYQGHSIINHAEGNWLKADCAGAQN
jgi:hypothetical protein